MAVTDHDVRANGTTHPGTDPTGPGGADSMSLGPVRYQRVVVDQPDLRLTIDAHPTLTIVAVPPQLVPRTAWTLANVLTRTQPGVHAEITDSLGRGLLLFRPHGARPRVVDLDSQNEIDPQDIAGLPQLIGSQPDGTMPAPATTGSGAEATGTAPTAPTTPTPAEIVRRLSALDQKPLWAAAEQLSDASRQGAQVLQEMETGTSSKHRFFGRKGGRDRRGRNTRTVTDALVVLEQAGAQWRSLAGDIPLHEALALRPGIQACAEARARTAALQTMAAGQGDQLTEEAVEAASQVVAELVSKEARLPQVLVLPPPNVGRFGLQLTLDLLPGLLSGRQTLIVTSSVNVADWGRLEAHADRARVVLYRT